ncbi:MAG: alpha/beta fold hydrolase [Myxococcales bacterium]
MRAISMALVAFGSAVACVDAARSGDVPLSVHVAGRGPRCLVIPGGPGLDGRYLRMPELEKRLTLVYVDLAGTGATPRLPASEKYSVRRDVRGVEAVRASLGIERACVIGHSYGGIVAERYAIEHPGRVGTLVVYDSMARDGREFNEALLENAKWFNGKSWYPKALAVLTSAARAQTDAAATEAWATLLPLYFADFDARRADYERASRVPAYAEVARRRDDPRSFDLRKDLSAVAARTLVLVGKRDFIASEPFAREIAAAIPGAKLMVFERSGHMAHLEEPGTFARTVADFVEEK